MIRYTLPETLACPEVRLMAGNSANVTATIPCPVLNTHTHTEFICVQNGVWIKSNFLTIPSLWIMLGRNGLSKIVRRILELYYFSGPLARRCSFKMNSPFPRGSCRLWLPPLCCCPLLFIPPFSRAVSGGERADAVPGASVPSLTPLLLGVPVTPWICPHILGPGGDCQITTFNS